MKAEATPHLAEEAAIRILTKLDQYRKGFPEGKGKKYILYRFVGMHRDVKHGVEFNDHKQVSFLPWEFQCQINEFGFFLINFTEPYGYTESENTTTFSQEIAIKYLVEVIFERFRIYTNAYTKEAVEYIEGCIDNWISQN